MPAPGIFEAAREMGQRLFRVEIIYRLALSRKSSSWRGLNHAIASALARTRGGVAQWHNINFRKW